MSKLPKLSLKIDKDRIALLRADLLSKIKEMPNFGDLTLGNIVLLVTGLDITVPDDLRTLADIMQENEGEIHDAMKAAAGVKIEDLDNDLEPDAETVSVIIGKISNLLKDSPDRKFQKADIYRACGISVGNDGKPAGKMDKINLAAAVAQMRGDNRVIPWTAKDSRSERGNWSMISAGQALLAAQ